MKKLLALLLALVTLLSALPLAGAAFKDEGFIAEEYQKAVAAMSAQGIINGFEDGSFGPKKTLTRAQAAKILCVMLEGEKESALTKTETGFSDVPATHWAAKYVAYCVDKGIVAGVGDGKFDPNGQLSSAAFAKMLLVAYGKGGDGFTGAEWLQNVQAAAEQTFLLYNLADKVTTGSIERQKAAQMAFNAKFQADAEADKAKGDSRTMPIEVPETMKLFVIGNSYGNDCSISYLWNILKELGVKDLTIGTLYYSGCRYRQHVNFFLQDQPVYSLEMSKEQLVNRLFALEAQVDAQSLRTGNLKDSDWEKLIESAGIIGKSKLMIDDTPGISISELRSKCRKMKLEHGLDIIIIDYLQLMTGRVGGRSESRQQEISEISRALKGVARELNVPVIALSQLSRAVEQRPDHRPMMSDLRESGAIEQDADVVMFIYRDDYYNKDTELKNVAEIIIAKQRNGAIGTINLTWLPQYTKFANYLKE